MEAEVKLIVSGNDKHPVKEMLPKCEKEYEELMQKETGKEYKCHLELDEVTNLPADAFGGVNLTTRDGRIVCQNTVAGKLRLAYDELLPEIRALLFPSKK